MNQSTRKYLLKVLHPKTFNCGGYALDTFTWYNPCYGFDYFFDSEEENDKKIDFLSEIMLEEFPDMRRIDSPDEVGKNEYVIAFRITQSIFDFDFHFIRRGRNGVWYEKMGARMGINRVSKEEVFAPSWKNKYFGKIAFFAKKVCENA